MGADARIDLIEDPVRGPLVLEVEANEPASPIVTAAAGNQLQSRRITMTGLLPLAR